MNMETTRVDRFGEQSEITSTRTLLTWKIDNLCSEGIMRQLQSPQCTQTWRTCACLWYWGWSYSQQKDQITTKEGLIGTILTFFVKAQRSGQLHAQYSDCAAFWGCLTPGRDMKIAVCGLIWTEFGSQIARTNVNQWHWQRYSSPGQDCCSSGCFL